MQVVFDSDYKNEDVFTLNKEESAHLVRVLRMKEGEEVFLTNGKGCFFKSEILEANPSRCTLKILSKEKEREERKFKVHLAIAPTKNIDRIEWLIEKATEIGVDEITFLLCEHSERKHINLERLEKIVISAIKQSLKAYKPIIHPLTKFKNFVEEVSAEQKLLAYCEGENRGFIKDICTPLSSYVILIGPEGDFSHNEVELALNNNFSLITLGTQRLRTETAGLYALSTLHFLNQ